MFNNLALGKLRNMEIINLYLQRIFSRQINLLVTLKRGICISEMINACRILNDECHRERLILNASNTYISRT